MLLVVSSLFVFIPSQSEAYYLYDAGNSSAELPGEKHILYKMDFSEEPLGTLEIGHKENVDFEHRIVEVINTGTERGKVLCLNVTNGTVGGTYVGGWHTGHKISSGIVYFDYKLCLECYGGGSGGFIGFGVCDGRNYYTGTTISFAEYGIYNDYLYTYNNVNIGYTNASYFGEWVDVHTIIDLDNDISTLQFNNITVATCANAAQVLTHFLIYIGPLSNPSYETYYRQALIDDICLYTHEQEVSLSANGSEQLTSIGFTFDDNSECIYTNVFPKMNHALMDASIAVVSSWVGVANKTTWEQLDEMATAGWELMAHSYDHSDHATLDESEIRSQMEISSSAIIENTSVDVVHGYEFPFNSYNALALQIGWEKFDYLGAPGYDLDRYLLTSVSDSLADNYRLCSIILCTKYSYGGHLEFYTHGVYAGATGSNIDQNAWDYLIDRLIANNSRVITHYDALMTRNANSASVSGNATAFTISYPTNAGNFRNSSVYVTLIGNFSDNTYVAVRDGDIIARGTPSEGILTLLVEAGDYRIMTEAYYMAEQIGNAISPIIAIIPLVILLSIISMVIGKGRKLK